MTKKSRCKFSAEFKAKVVLEALKDHITIEELARIVCLLRPEPEED